MKKYEHNYGKNPEGVLSTTSGYATETTNFGEAAFGILNKSTRDKNNFTTPEVVSSGTATLFSVGNGSDGIRKNIIELKADGTVLISGVGGYDGTNPDDATGIADKMQGVEGNINRFEEVIDSISVVKDETNDLVYTLMVDGEERGSINIPKDQFLKSVTYDEDTNELIFTFVTSESDNQEVRVNMTDLVDTYTAGNGINIDNKQVSVKIDGTSDPYITISENGIKVSGIDEEIAALNAKDTELNSKIGSNTYEGSNYLTKETNLTDAVIQLDEEVKATNDNLALEHANAEAAYAKKTDLSRYIYNSYNPLNGEGYEINCRACKDNGTHDSFRISCKAKQSTPVINFSTFPSYNESSFRDNTGIAIYPGGIFFGCYSGTGGVPVITDLHGNYKEPDEYRYSRCFIENENDTEDLAFGTKKTSDGSHGNFIFYYGNIKLMSGSQGIFIKDKTSSDLLNAAGGTTTLKTLGGESILGTGNFDVATEEDIQALFN